MPDMPDKTVLRVSIARVKPVGIFLKQKLFACPIFRLRPCRIAVARRTIPSGHSGPA